MSWRHDLILGLAISASRVVFLGAVAVLGLRSRKAGSKAAGVLFALPAVYYFFCVWGYAMDLRLDEPAVAEDVIVSADVYPVSGLYSPPLLTTSNVELRGLGWLHSPFPVSLPRKVPPEGVPCKLVYGPSSKTIFKILVERPETPDNPFKLKNQDRWVTPR